MSGECQLVSITPEFRTTLRFVFEDERGKPYLGGCVIAWGLYEGTDEEAGHVGRHVLALGLDDGYLSVMSDCSNFVTVVDLALESMKDVERDHRRSLKRLGKLKKLVKR